MRLPWKHPVRLDLSRQTLRSALLRPEPFLALLVLLVAVAFFVSGLGHDRAPLPVVEIVEPEKRTLELQEVRLVRFDASGLENPTFASVALPESLPQRLEAILAALRETMGDGEWPENLPTPTVYVERAARQTVAILDFRPAGPIPLTVEGELRLLRSIQETVLANGVDDIRFLLDGEAAGVFLEHLTVPASL